MRRLISTVLVVALISLVACAPTPTSSTPIPTPKKITLDDAEDILNLSFLLPGRFEQIDPASEGLSNEDLGMGPDFSEFQLFLSEKPFQMIYCVIGINKSRIERAAFDSMIEDEYQMESVIIENIRAGAAEEGLEVTVPDVEITHPDIGDSSLYGEGYIDSYGIHFGFDTLWFRSNTVYVLIYSLYMSADKVSLIPIGEEIEKRIGKFSQ